MPRCEKAVTPTEPQDCKITYTYNIPIPETEVFKRGYLQALKDVDMGLRQRNPESQSLAHPLLEQLAEKIQR